MRVLLVIPSITNYFTFLEDLAGQLHERGHDVHLATSTRQITETDSYKRGMVATLHPIDFPRALNFFSHLRAARNLRRVVRTIRPDVISVHFSAALFTTAMARTNGWPVTTGMIHGLGSPTIQGWRRFIIARAEDWYARQMDELFVLTDDDRQLLVDRVPQANVKLLSSFGLGCDLDRFNLDAVGENKRSELREELEIATDDLVYIFIGRQTYFKGFDKVVRAFMHVYPQDFRQKLLLVGNKDRIHSTHLTDEEETEMENHPGIIQVGWREDVENFLALAHINVFPSHREGLPVNLMESLAMAVPVITINSRGCKEVVSHGLTGLVLTEDSVESIAEAMSYLRDNKEIREKFAQNSVADRKKFDRTKFIESQFEVMSRLTGLPV